MLRVEDYRKKQIAAGLAYAAELSWEDSAKPIEAALREFVFQGGSRQNKSGTKAHRQG